MSCSTKFKHNPISDLSGNEQNCSTNQRPGNRGNLLECNQNLVRPGDALSEFAHPFWVKSNQLSVDARQLLNESEARECQEFTGAKSKVNRLRRGPPWNCLRVGRVGVGVGLGFGVGWSDVGWGGGGLGWGWRTWLLTKFELNLSCLVTSKGVVFVFGLTQSVATSCHDNESHSAFR